MGRADQLSIKEPQRSSTTDEEHNHTIHMKERLRLSTLLSRLGLTNQTSGMNLHQPFRLLSTTDGLDGAPWLIARPTCSAELNKDTLQYAF